MVLFGSQAVGNVANGSDFDIAVSFKDGKSIFDDLVKYSEMLENFSKIFLPAIKNDLTDLNNANILLRYEITGMAFFYLAMSKIMKNLRLFLSEIIWTPDLFLSLKTL